MRIAPALATIKEFADDVCGYDGNRHTKSRSKGRDFLIYLGGRMNKLLKAKYHKLLKAEDKDKLLEKHFLGFLAEAIFRSTKIEHVGITRRNVTDYLR